MNKWIKYFILPAALAILSFNSNADNGNYYLGLGLGQSSFQLNETNIIADNTGLIGDSNFTDNASAFSFFAGLPLDEHLSLELDFVSSGDISARQSGRQIKLFDVSTLAVTAMLSKQMTENTKLFGRIGAHMWDISESSGDLDTINNAVDITYGLGADINIYGSESRLLRLQWNHYEYDGTYIDSNDIISLSLLFKIGGDS